MGTTSQHVLANIFGSAYTSVARIVNGEYYVGGGGTGGISQIPTNDPTYYAGGAGAGETPVIM